MTGFPLLSTAALLAGLALPVEEVRVAGAVARLQVDRQRILLSDDVMVTITVEGPAPLEVEPIRYLTTSREWDEKAEPPQKTTLPDGRERWQQVFRLEPRAPSAEDKPFALDLTPLAVRSADGEGTVTWKPLLIEVTTRLEQPTLGQARDIRPIEQTPPPPPGPPWQLAVSIGLGALAVAVLLTWAWRRRRRPVVEPSPHQEALAALALLVRAETDSEHFFRSLAMIVRRYLDRRFGLHSREQTTEEFLTALPEPLPWPSGQQQALADLLHRCDLAKFARIPFAAEERRASAEWVRHFVEWTTPTEERQAVAGTVGSS